MKAGWRWFGPDDPVSINDIAQAEATSIVTALHHIPNGEVWSIAEIKKRKSEIGTFKDGRSSGLTWDVVESLPVSEDIKQQVGDWRAHIENYKTSLSNLATCGINVVCYNFMPVLDWTRTDLAYPLANGGHCMRFDIVDFAVFDIHILAREGAHDDYDDDIRSNASETYLRMSDERKQRLARNIISGLPGAEEGYDLDGLRAQLAQYEQIDAEKLRTHLIAFLSEVAPVAQSLGMRLCCHPDDPPFSLLGLPRVMSDADDYRRVFTAVDLPANGMTFCTGSLGASPKNDLTEIAKEFASRTHFLHLRNVQLEGVGAKTSFHESTHLKGSAYMVEIIQVFLSEEKRREEEGRQDCNLVFRPDHGQAILSDLNMKSQPGYPAVGRLKGLAELRGIISALN